jgi:hypothetical protein
MNKLKPKIKKKPEMVQLSGDGKTIEATMSGNQRVYSRPDTMKIIQMAKIANSPGKLLELGRFIMQATKTQDAKPPEFTNE